VGQLATGAEVQCEIGELGIIITDNVSPGVNLIQTGGASIPRDTQHVPDNLVVVRGACAVNTSGGTECRVTNIAACRQYPPVGSAAVVIGGTDHMVERITVAQPPYSAGVQGGLGGSGIYFASSNTRAVSLKVLGGNAVGSAMSPTVLVNGSRSQVIGAEVQDYAGAFGVQDVVGNNKWLGVVCDSCYNGGVQASAPTYMREVLYVNRSGGAFVMTWAIEIDNGPAGIDIEATVVGVQYAIVYPGETPLASGRIRINNMGGSVHVPYAASLGSHLPRPSTSPTEPSAVLAIRVTC
jgi:hypothetical protein